MPWSNLAALQGGPIPGQAAAARSSHASPMTAHNPAPSSRSEPRIRPVPAVARAIAIMRLLGRRREPMNVKSIADELDLVPSTCLHILRALAAERMVSFDPSSKRYKLGAGILALARGVMETDSFSQAVQPILDEIAVKWQVTAIGVEVLGLDHIIVTALADSKLPFRLHVDIGSRFPALISASGRLVAAFGGHSEKQLRAKFDTLRWQKPIRFDDWLQDVELARQNGHSADYGNYIGGIAIIAVPVLDAFGHITHTIVAAGILDQLTPDSAETLIGEMKTHAENLSRQLYSLE
ncbi:MAG TPA: IclR family transcriptional regulator [Burkholderiaceae bacterium]|nr:IclR family transcriptional regulator [Burkholderiaceae bacterium]